MGAKLIQVGELELWLRTQEHNRNLAPGSNVFTYKPLKQAQKDENFIEDESLVEELNRLHMLAVESKPEFSTQIRSQI